MNQRTDGSTEESNRNSKSKDLPGSLYDQRQNLTEPIQSGT